MHDIDVVADGHEVLDAVEDASENVDFGIDQFGRAPDPGRDAGKLESVWHELYFLVLGVLLELDLETLVKDLRMVL